MKRDLLEFLITVKREGKHVVAYGAPGKGNTLLNYCGIRTDFVDYAVDANEFKQGRYTPGTHIPIYHPSRMRETKPDFVLILPWNIRDEVTSQHSYIREWGGRFVVPIPETMVLGDPPGYGRPASGPITPHRVAAALTDQLRSWLRRTPAHAHHADEFGKRGD